jgi:hypothetical protein
MTPEEQERKRKETLDSLYEQYSGTEDILEIQMLISNELDMQNKSISNYFDTQKRVFDKIQQAKKAEKALTVLKNELLNLVQLEKEDATQLNELQEKRLKALKEIVPLSEKNLFLLEQETKALMNNANIYESIFNSLKDGLSDLLKQEFTFKSIWNYLQSIDGAIRKYQLELGISGDRADFLREQTENAVNASARYGGNIEDIIELQKTLNDITGRGNVFTEKQITTMVAIAKGTGMANQEVGQLIGNMLLFGSSIEDGKKLIENSIVSINKLGLNSTKIFKTVSNNIDKLNKYRFQNGVEGLLKMTQISEKFKISLDGAFAAADKFRTLEGLLETGASLRVLGGEFAKMDEFKFSFLARNKPDEFAQALSNLTRGMASFNKETGMFDISDIDMDKLRIVAELTGRGLDDVVQNARELNKINFAKKQIFIGSDEDKEMIAKLATFQKGSTIGYIQIGDENVRLDKLTEENIELYKTLQKTFEQRAKDSQNFNDTLNNTIMQFKSTLLPVLEVINSVLKGFNSIIDIARDENDEMKKWAAIVPITIMAATMGLFKLFGALPSLLGKIPSIGKFFGGGGGGDTTATTTPQSGSQLLGAGKNAMYKGFGNAAQLAAIGVAAVGIGYGFKLASEGASSLADSLKSLNDEQLHALTDSLNTLGLLLGGTLIAAVVTLGIAGSAGAVGLLAFGAAALMVGAGIGLAAMGIGEMVKGFATIGNVDLTDIGLGMMGIAGAALMLSNPLSVLGLASIGVALYGISKLDFSNIVPLQNLKFVDEDIKKLKELSAIITQISTLDLSKLNALSKIFTNGELKVKLDGNAVVRNELTITVDGDKFYKKVDKIIDIKMGKPIGDSRIVKIT